MAIGIRLAGQGNERLSGSVVLVSACTYSVCTKYVEAVRVGRHSPTTTPHHSVEMPISFLKKETNADNENQHQS